MDTEFQKMAEQVAEKLGATDEFMAVVRFVEKTSGDGITIDASERPVLTNSTEIPKVTLTATFDTFRKLLDGEASPWKIIPTRKLKVEGSNGVGLRLLNELSRK